MYMYIYYVYILQLRKENGGYIWLIQQNVTIVKQTHLVPIWWQTHTSLHKYFHLLLNTYHDTQNIISYLIATICNISSSDSDLILTLMLLFISV